MSNEFNGTDRQKKSEEKIIPQGLKSIDKSSSSGIANQTSALTRSSLPQNGLHKQSNCGNLFLRQMYYKYLYYAEQENLRVHQPQATRRDNVCFFRPLKITRYFEILEIFREKHRKRE